MNRKAHQRVEGWLQIAIVMLVSSGALLLGSGQRDFQLATLVLFAGVSSIIFTDRLGWFRLPRLLANVLMILLAFYWLCVFFGSDAGIAELISAVFSGRLTSVLRGGTDSFSRLISIASLLVYVQLVMLYQKKTLRIYGHLAIFSLLQVVVAALINTGWEFGLGLVLYITISFFVISLFHLFRQATLIERQLRRASQKANRHRQAQLQQLQPGSQRAALIGSLPVPSLDRSARVTAAGVLGWGFTRHLLGIGVGTLLFAIAFFFCMPRTGNSSWQQPGFGHYRQVGFRRDVQLSDVGQLLMSNEIALKVSYSDATTGGEYPVFREPYMRGAVLTRYRYDNQGNSHWYAMEASPLLSSESLRVPEPLSSRDLVRQEVLIEMNDDPALMAIFPVYKLPDTDQHVAYDPSSNQLHLSRSRRSPAVKQYRYVLATDAFRDGVQAEMNIKLVHDSFDKDLFSRELAEMESLPTGIARLRRFTSEHLEQANIDTNNPVLVCRTLEQFLQSDAFQYTLNLGQIQQLRQYGRDQVEDFVLNHRIGNCEYYASALVLMLRSQGIPARMIIGFRGGELNQTGNYFTVYQRNAHAWVEAFLQPDRLSPGLSEGVDPDKIRGVWLRLDPTPVFRPEQEAPARSLSDRVVDAFDYLQLLWDNNVLRLNPEQQRQAVFQQLGWDPEQGFQSLASLPLLNWLRLDFSRGWKSAIISWQFLLWLVVGPCLVWLVTRQLRQSLLARQASRPAAQLTHSELLEQARCGFFLEVELLLAGHGLKRQASQTQREFIESCQRELPAREIAATVDGLLNTLLETYYRVRFGNQPLDERDQGHVDQQVDLLRQQLAVAGSNQVTEVRG